MITNEPQESMRSPQDRANGIADQAAPLLSRASEQVNALAQRGVDAMRDTMRDTSRQLREKAAHASDVTVAYVKDEPVKAMLIAAATGAALMALVSLIRGSRGR